MNNKRLRMETHMSRQTSIDTKRLKIETHVSQKTFMIKNKHGIKIEMS